MELLFALDLPDWLQWALRIKNLLIGALIVAVVVGGVLEDRRKRTQ
jgi:hypothetical protein